MLKKSLFAIALVGLLASVAMAGDEVIWRGEGCAWPWIHCYKPLDICKIPVYLKVGYYVKIDKCNGLKILMAPSGVDYVGCTDFTISSNFNMVIGARVVVNSAGTAIKGAGDWSAYIDTGGVVRQRAGKTETHKICVKVKEPNMLAMSDPTAHNEVRVGDAYITVKPQCTSGGDFSSFSWTGNSGSIPQP